MPTYTWLHGVCPYAVLGLLIRLKMLKYKCYVTKKSIDVYKNIVQVK